MKTIMEFRKLITGSLLFFALAGCGTTSNIQPSEKTELVFSAKQFNTILIGFFESDSSLMEFKGRTQEIIDEDRRAYDEKSVIVIEQFKEILAAELRTGSSFNKIEIIDNGIDDLESEEALLINGTITRFKEGDSASRLLIGLGQGMSYFDATVHIRDKTTGELLGTVIIDKNSWALGGAIAWKQGIESHMKSAAKKITLELEKSK